MGKSYGLKKLRDASGITLEAMMFIGDAIFPGGKDFPAKELGLDTVSVRDPRETLAAIEAIIAFRGYLVMKGHPGTASSLVSDDGAWGRI